MNRRRTRARVPNFRSRAHFPDLHSSTATDLLQFRNTERELNPEPYPYAAYHYSDNTLSFAHFPTIHCASAMKPMGTDTDTSGSSSSTKPYPYAYHYVNDILSFVEFSDGSFQVPFAYHFDITNIRLYFVEFKDGSVVTVTKVGPDSCVKSSRDYLVESHEPVRNWGVDSVITPTEIEEVANSETEKKKIEPKSTRKGNKQVVEASQEQSSNGSGSANLCMDRLREELSCAICLEICFEPGTTPCGHSFCNECLRSAADICGNRCPKCRQFISKRRFCAVNTVLWNTIQLIFPEVVEGRKAAGALNSRETQNRSAIRTDSHSNISRRRTDRVQMLHHSDHTSRSPQSLTPSGTSWIGGDVSSRTWRELPPIQDQDEDEDAALALLLQREEFMETYSSSDSDDW